MLWLTAYTRANLINVSLKGCSFECVTWDPYGLFKNTSDALMAWFSCSLVTALSKLSSENSIHTKQGHTGSLLGWLQVFPSITTNLLDYIMDLVLRKP